MEQPNPSVRPPLSGVFPILATPFRPDGSPDTDDLGRLIDFIVRSGADGVVFPGVASEFETLAPGERRDLVDLVARRLDHRLPLVVGVSAASAADALAHARQAAQVGASAVMAMAPSTLKDDAAALADFYATVCQAGVPVILQNAPVPTGCGLTPERVLELVRAHPLIEYVKEETLPCGQRISRLLETAPAGLRGVFGGAGGRYLPDELARGAVGTMPACELTDLHAEQFFAHRAGDARRVRALFDRMLPLLNFPAVFRMAMTKEVLRRRGIIRSTGVRAAGPRLDAGDQRELDAILAGLDDLLPPPAIDRRNP